MDLQLSLFEPRCLYGFWGLNSGSCQALYPLTNLSPAPLCLFETRSHYAAQVSLELVILLPRLPDSWDGR